MLRLNIISTTLKKEIKTKSLYRAVNKLSIIIFVTAIIYSLCFFSAKMILQTHFNELVNNNTLLNRGPQNHIVAVKNINGNIKKIEDIQNKSIYWSYLIEDIYALTNANILINKIQAESGNNILRLQGSAGTRDALLEFQQNLEKNDIFAEVELPIQSLLSKTNIDFNMSLKLNSYEFK